MMDTLKRVGNLIRAKRLELGWSQEELAHQAGKHRTYISSIERGARNPTITVLHAIAKAMGTSVSELLSGLKASDTNSKN